jgi:putative NIF3 family GTP cyclohydrolase 1 type 2
MNFQIQPPTMMLHKLLCLSIILGLFFSCADPKRNTDQNTTDAVLTSNGAITANEVINRIKKGVNCEWQKETVDTFKGGDPEQKVTGIATTFLANMDVLKRAKAQGLNLIITHEPTYYNHYDETDMLAGDPVYLAKKKYIEDNGLIIWRFHDHWHQTKPDGIHEGMIDELGWNEYQQAPDKLIFNIPQTTVRDLAKRFNKLYKSNAVRVTGKPSLKVTKVGLVVGSPGYMNHIRMMQSEDIEVLLIGEANEWETVEYFRDGIGLGEKIALISLGHANSEEGGMAYCAKWLKDLVSEVPIKHLPAGDPYWTVD